MVAGGMTILTKTIRQQHQRRAAAWRGTCCTESGYPCAGLSQFAKPRRLAAAATTVARFQHHTAAKGNQLSDRRKVQEYRRVSFSSSSTTPTANDREIFHRPDSSSSSPLYNNTSGILLDFPPPDATNTNGMKMGEQQHRHEEGVLQSVDRKQQQQLDLNNIRSARSSPLRRNRSSALASTAAVATPTIFKQHQQHPPNFFPPLVGNSTGIVPVSAIHVASTIHLQKLSLSAVASEIPSLDQLHFGKNSVVMRLTSTTEHDTGNNNNPSSSSSSSSSSPRYMAVFRFGSIVFFNVAPPEAARITAVIKSLASEGAVQLGAERREQFGVLVVPPSEPTSELSSASAISTAALNETKTEISKGQQSEQSNVPLLSPMNNVSSTPSFAEAVTGDYCLVSELDMNSVAVISTIMAQTVALDRYSDTVDDLLSNFARINAIVSKTGNFTPTDKSFLFKTVAQNNSIVIDMISKVRIKDRSDTAWNLTKYESIHYGLKEEFVSVFFCFHTIA